MLEQGPQPGRTTHAMDLLIQVGIIVAGFCLFVTFLEGCNGRRRKRELDLRHQLLIDEWVREHPYESRFYDPEAWK